MRRDLRERSEILKHSPRKEEAERKRMRMKSLHVHVFPVTLLGRNSLTNEPRTSKVLVDKRVGESLVTSCITILLANSWQSSEFFTCSVPEKETVWNIVHCLNIQSLLIPIFVIGSFFLTNFNIYFTIYNFILYYIYNILQYSIIFIFYKIFYKNGKNSVNIFFWYIYDDIKIFLS